MILVALICYFCLSIPTTSPQIVSESTTSQQSVTSSQEITKGQVIDKVTCAGNPTNSYALYLPSNYEPTRKWPILYAFDPGARGRVPVERFKEAAERFGWIVAGSNNSRNASGVQSSIDQKPTSGQIGRINGRRRRLKRGANCRDKTNQANASTPVYPENSI